MVGAYSETSHTYSEIRKASVQRTHVVVPIAFAIYTYHLFYMQKEGVQVYILLYKEKNIFGRSVGPIVQSEYCQDELKHENIKAGLCMWICVYDL